MKLEIGCGKRPKPGFVTCDIRHTTGVNVVCDARQLPFADDSIDAIYSRHLIEHFTLKDALALFVEWNRTLRPSGQLYLICPNLLWHLKQVLEGSHESFYEKERGSNARYWGFGSLFGWQQDQYDVHRFGWYAELLRDALESCGFGEITDLTASEKSMEQAPWHLEVRAQKTRKPPPLQDNRIYRHFSVEH
jgi:predicted SAM-dependent methyltransferase